MKRVGILLIGVTLMAGMASCSGGVESYVLAIASTEGGSVTAPGEGVFTYDEGTVVNLTAEAEGDYRFANWTGNAGSIADAEAAITTITMSDSYFVTAKFVAVCKLTTNSTEGGSVTVPGEGVFPYDKGVVIDLTAAAEEGYHFVSWTGDVEDIADVYSATTAIVMNTNCSITAHFIEYTPMVDAGTWHTVGLRDNGSVIAAGHNEYLQCDVVDWMGITQISAGGYHTVGLKSDGIVVAMGLNDYGQRDVSSWMNIVQVSAGSYHTVGLKDDGTVIAMGWNNEGQCEVHSWTNIVQISAGGYHTVGLKSDGTVVAVGLNNEEQCEVGGWMGITQISAGGRHTVGLKTDGTVVAVGQNIHEQCEVDLWTNIIQVAAGESHALGIKTDSTVVAIGDNSDNQCNVESWTDIIQVSGGRHTVGLKSDGTVIAVGPVGSNDYGQCDVGDWDLS